MRSLWYLIVLLLTLTCVVDCGFDCADNKTAMPRASQTLKEAQKKGLLRFEFIPDKTTIELDSGVVFDIKNAWVENNWKYDCVNNKSQIIKDSLYQFIIDADYINDQISLNYWLENISLEGLLCFDYLGKDTVILNLYKEITHKLPKSSAVINTITFIKQ